MGKKILVDTDVLIKAYRGDSRTYKELQRIKSDFCISAITAMELYAGAGSIKKLTSLRRELKAYEILHLNEDISATALKFFSTYHPASKLYIPDFLIAATALHYGMELYTDNKKEYRIIRALKFYNEKYV
ncbi:MAG: type II toxin-antitoxin system VapC family toxin [Chitinophagaceae bacterium]|nr:type II toxin-antitoxin system VapC family toxin [Chitinophagaceae bacterium]